MKSQVTYKNIRSGKTYQCTPAEWEAISTKPLFKGRYRKLSESERAIAPPEVNEAFPSAQKTNEKTRSKVVDVPPADEKNN